MTTDKGNTKEKGWNYSALIFAIGIALAFDGIKVLSPPASFVFETVGIVLIFVSIVAYWRQHIRKKKAEKDGL